MHVSRFQHSLFLSPTSERTVFPRAPLGLCFLAIMLILLGTVGCRSGAYRAANLPQEFRARPNPGDVTFNMARMTGSGYDNSLIGTDDLLEVTVVSGRDEEKLKPVSVRVAKDGTVDVSPIGPVHVSNLDPVDASQQIATVAIERGIYMQPNVTVEFKKKAVNHITVLGAVEEPGMLEVPRNSSDVVSAIAMAGGITEEAGTQVEIIRQRTKPNGHTRFAENETLQDPTGSDGEVELAAYSTLANPGEGAQFATGGAGEQITQQINLAELVNRGIHDDYRLQDRDVVMVKLRPKRTIHVGGLVKAPGQFELPHTEDVRILDAIALAGGSSSIVADKVLVIRPVKGRPQPLVIQASLERAKHNGQENLILMEGDLVSIEQTPATAVFDTASRLFHLTIGVTGNNFF
jgi:polysaccharide export outer membrane protein